LEFVRDRVGAEAPKVMARVIIKGRSIVIYESPKIRHFDTILKNMGGLPNFMIRELQSTGPMSPAFRFKLIDKHERRFEALRFCFRGSVDDWFSLHDVGSLDELCQRYLKHMGKESFYELM
jgi:hypothetical protein